MNLDNNPTVEELRDLLRSCDDLSGHHVLWVGKNGDVHVSQIPKGKTPVEIEVPEPDVQLRYETFQAGNGYVGPDAAADDEWVRQLFGELTREWPRAKKNAVIECVGI